MWADWIAETLYRVRSSPIEVGFENGESHPTHKIGKLSVTVAQFCRTCNNTWMSGIDNDVKPILEPMILRQAQAITLSPDDQICLSRWAFKTALVAEFALRGKHVIPDKWYRDFYRRRLPPDPGCLIWTTAYGGHEKPGHAHKRTLPLTGDFPVPNSELKDRKTTETFLITLAALRAVFQVFGCTDWEWHPTSDGGVESQQLLIRLWPPTSNPATWPRNSIALSDTALLDFCNREDFLDLPHPSH